MIHIICGEIKKYYKLSLKERKNIYVTFLWPILIFIHTYFSYKPFWGMNINFAEFKNTRDLLDFLIIGVLTYNCFFSLVRSALFMRREREDGVLELIMLSPANKIALMYGRTLGAFIQNTWMFWGFSILVMGITNGFAWVPLKLLKIFLIISVFSCVWGGFINTIFLFSRDAEIVFYLLDEPMMFFSGVKVPVRVFPFIGKIIAFCFPLTYVLIWVRAIWSEEQKYIVHEIIIGGIYIYFILIVFFTIVLLKYAEKHLMDYGDASFY